MYQLYSLKMNFKGRNVLQLRIALIQWRFKNVCLCVCVLIQPVLCFCLSYPACQSLQCGTLSKKILQYIVRFDSSVGVATRYRMDGPAFKLRSGQEVFSVPRPSRSASGAHRASCAMGNGSLFPDWGPGGGEVHRPRRGLDHPPSPSAEVRN